MNKLENITATIYEIGIGLAGAGLCIYSVIKKDPLAYFAGSTLCFGTRVFDKYVFNKPTESEKMEDK